ncbi:MAG: NAD-dependent epimerase/dehydratase family protein, partial [candidate division NC10 bacterium]|nr:NAD-dependent epimerase/dehydratase family protein [candidate division NC10 bacterium]
MGPPPKSIVTGVAGFIGSHLAERLLQEGHRVLGIDSFLDSYPRALKEANLQSLSSHPSFSFLEGSLLELDLRSILEGADYVFHQAALAGVRTSWGKSFKTYLDNNVLSTPRLLEAAREGIKGLKRIVYASSSSIYGDLKELPLKEDCQPQPHSPYGVTKLAGEHLCQLYYRNYGLHVVSLRYFTVYGPRQRPDMAF